LGHLFRGYFLETALDGYVLVNRLLSAAFGDAQALTGQAKTAIFNLIERKDAGFDHHAADFYSILCGIPPPGRTRRHQVKKSGSLDVSGLQELIVDVTRIGG